MPFATSARTADQPIATANTLADVAPPTMREVNRQEHSVSVVVLGDFNPAIMHPLWFSRENLIRESEAEAASVQIVHQDVAIFSTDWLKVDANRKRMTLVTQREDMHEPLRDLAGSTLSKLRHTPTRAIGINHDQTFGFPDRESFDDFGWAVVPPDDWKSVLNRPGLVALAEQGERTDGYDGYTRVSIAPILDGSTRVTFAVNDHFQISAENETQTTAVLEAILTDRWEDISARADRLVTHIMERWGNR